MKTYFRCITGLLLAVALIGLILPALFSANSSEAVFLGIVLAALSPIIFWKLFLAPLKRTKKNESH